MAKKSRNFVVLSSNARIYEQEDRWMKSRPGVVDIASIRETPHGVRLSCHPGSYPRRGKILHFNGDEPERVITMPPQNNRVTSEDDPDPGNFPSAA